MTTGDPVTSGLTDAERAVIVAAVDGARTDYGVALKPITDSVERILSDRTERLQAELAQARREQASDAYTDALRDAEARAEAAERERDGWKYLTPHHQCDYRAALDRVAALADEWEETCLGTICNSCGADNFSGASRFADSLRDALAADPNATEERSPGEQLLWDIFAKPADPKATTPNPEEENDE